MVAVGVPLVLVGVELDGDEQARAGRGGVEEAEEPPREEAGSGAAMEKAKAVAKEAGRWVTGSASGTARE
jgi:hypothetical protein